MRSSADPLSHRQNSPLARAGTACNGRAAPTSKRTMIASGRAARHDNWRRLTLDKSFGRPVFHRSIQREPISARAGPCLDVRRSNRGNLGGTDERMRSESAGS